MAGPNVGNAYINVEARADRVADQIKRGFGNPNKIGRRYGESLGQAFSRGFNRFADRNTLSRFSEGLKTAVPGAEAARKAWAGLTRTSFTLQTAISVLIGGLASVVGGLGALAGAAGGAAASLIVVANGGFALVAGMIAAKLALSGVGRALSALNKQSGAAVNNTKAVESAERALARVIETNRENLIDANNAVREAQLELNEAFRQGREDIQELGFEAEDAALSEKRAALELEKARETLARVQDLPPNSRARKEAELAFQEAELKLREAKDKSSDLNKEQDRLAKTGVAGTKVVIDATNKLAQAELNKAKTVRDGLRDQADAERNLADAKDQSAGAGGGADPLAGLNEYQKNFVKFLMGLKPLYDELKLAASAAFLPPLQQAIQLLADKAFPTIKTGISQVAGAMGNASISLATAITNAENLGDLQVVFRTSAYVIESLGRSMGNMWDAVMSLMSAAAPLTKRFVDFIEKKSDAFARFLDTKEATGELRDFFKRAGDIMADFGAIFGNIFKGFGQLIKANFGPGSGGDYLVQWLKTATGKFADLDKTAGGGNNLSKYFRDAAENSQKIFSSIGSLLGRLIELGANKAIGQTFDELAKGAPALANIVEKSIEAGPKLAALVVTITEIIDKFTDTKSMDIFFDTLNTFATIINELLKNEFVVTLVTIVGQITAFGLALGAVSKLGMFAFKGIVGSLISLSGVAGKAVTALGFLGDAFFNTGVKGQAARTSMMNFGKSILKAGGWMLLISGAISGLQALGSSAELSDKEIEKLNQGVTNLSSKDINSMFDVKMDPTWYSASNSINDLNGALNALAGGGMAQANYGLGKFTTGFFSFIPGVKENYDLLTKNESKLKELGNSLGGMASTNLPLATLQFRQLAAAAGGGYDNNKKLLDTMPGYKDALTQLAGQLGLAATEENLLSLATGQNDKAQAIIQETMRKSSAAALDTSGKVQGLADKIRDFTNATSESINKELEYEQSLDDLTASLTANGTTFDITTQAGRDNTRALQDLASASSEAAAAAYEQDGDVAKLTATMDANRNEMINTMVQSGMTEEAAKGMVDQFMMTPEQIQTEVKSKGIPETKKEVEDLYNNTAVDKTATVTLDAKTGVGWNAFADKWKKGDIWGALTTKLWANGGLAAYANGGMRSYASGGLNGAGGTGIYRGRPGGLYKFAEPETGWEAFISGKAGQEKRNIEIWKEAGRRLGVLTDANSSGGLYGAIKAGAQSVEKSSSTPTSINQVSITVNPSPGMDERELAAAVSRELAFQMRKGAVA